MSSLRLAKEKDRLDGGKRTLNVLTAATSKTIPAAAPITASRLNIRTTKGVYVYTPYDKTMEETEIYSDVNTAISALLRDVKTGMYRQLNRQIKSNSELLVAIAKVKGDAEENGGYITLEGIDLLDTVLVNIEAGLVAPNLQSQPVSTIKQELWYFIEPEDERAAIYAGSEDQLKEAMREYFNKSGQRFVTYSYYEGSVNGPLKMVREYEMDFENLQPNNVTKSSDISEPYDSVETEDSEDDEVWESD